MALFGLPGGAEWLVIGATILFLFFPGALLVWLGFVLGRRSAGDAGKSAEGSPVGTAAATVSDADAEEIAETNDGD
jgi:hypothetical protein